MDTREERTRVDGFFPATIYGVDECGCVFRTNSSVDSISSKGMHVLLRRRVAAGSELDAVVRLESGARIATRGKVVGVGDLFKADASYAGAGSGEIAVNYGAI